MGSESPKLKAQPMPRRLGLFQAAGLGALSLTILLFFLGLFAEHKAEAIGAALGVGFLIFVSCLPLIVVARIRGYRQVLIHDGSVEFGDAKQAALSQASIATDLRDLNESLISWRQRALDAEAALARQRTTVPLPPPVHPPTIDRDDIANDPRWYEGEKGKLATFVYSDADGVVTDRQIRNWRSRYAYIEGFCLDRQEERTFRKDRIENWNSA